MRTAAEMLNCLEEQKNILPALCASRKLAYDKFNGNLPDSEGPILDKCYLLWREWVNDESSDYLWAIGEEPTSEFEYNLDYLTGNLEESEIDPRNFNYNPSLH